VTSLGCSVLALRGTVRNSGRLTQASHVGIGGRDFAKTRKFRNARDNPKVTLVIDDVLPPWRPRSVMVRGDAETLTEAVGAGGEPLGGIIRIHPVQVLSWVLDTTA